MDAAFYRAMRVTLVVPVKPSSPSRLSPSPRRWGGESGHRRFRRVRDRDAHWCPPRSQAKAPFLTLSRDG